MILTLDGIEVELHTPQKGRRPLIEVGIDYMCPDEGPSTAYGDLNERQARRLHAALTTWLAAVDARSGGSSTLNDS